MLSLLIPFLKKHPAFEYFKMGIIASIIGVIVGTSLSIFMPHKFTAKVAIKIGRITNQNLTFLIEEPDAITFRITSRPFINRIAIASGYIDSADLLDPNYGKALSTFNPKGSDLILISVSDYDQNRSLRLVSEVAKDLIWTHSNIVNSRMHKLKDFNNIKISELNELSDNNKIINDKNFFDADFLKIIGNEIQKLLSYHKTLTDLSNEIFVYNSQLIEDSYIESYSYIQRSFRFSIYCTIILQIILLGYVYVRNFFSKQHF